MKSHIFRNIFLAIGIFLLMSTFVNAKTVDLAWDPSPGPDVVGYKIYYKSGSSSLPFNGSDANEGSSPIDVGTNLTTSLTGLTDGQVHYIAVTAYDAAGYESAYSNIVASSTTVIITNHAPVMAVIGNKTVIEGSSLSFTVSASDPDGDSLIYSASSLPSGASFNASTRRFSWIPGTSQSGTYPVTFSVTDGNLGDAESVTLTVGNLNRPPVLAGIGNKTIDEGSNLSFTVSASDPDGDSLIYSASSLPSGASFNTSTHRFSWTPGTSQSGTYPVTFSVTDGNLEDAESVMLTVSNLNRPPTMATIGNKTVDEGSSLSFTVSASDPDGDGLTYSASSLPSGASFNTSTHRFSWTPGTSQSGTYPVTFSVTDGNLGDAESVTITVGDLNRTPVLAGIGNKTVDEGSSLSFTVSASDPDGDSLIYSVSGLPSGASFNTTTRRFNWTPEASQSGSYPVTFSVTDGNLSDVESVTISVGSLSSTELRFVAEDTGLPGVARVDGGDDSNNYVNDVPKADLDYTFQVVLQMAPNGELPDVILSLNGFAYKMDYTSGSVTTGATYTFTTRLGPAAVHSFHFETRDASGNQLARVPLESELTGPQVELMNGKNLVGITGDVDQLLLSSVESLGTPLSFRWIPDGSAGNYEMVDSGAAVVLGEGYVIKRSVSVLPAMAQFGENLASTTELRVQPGWNLISNPYAGNVQLSSIQVRAGSSEPLSWADAAIDRIVINGIYYYAGSDWGGSTVYESNVGQQGVTLIPRIGYWIYINSEVEDLSLIVPKPNQ